MTHIGVVRRQRVNCTFSLFNREYSLLKYCIALIDLSNSGTTFIDIQPVM